MTSPELFEVVIVGAGIAGSAAAAQLAGSGVSVLVLERQDDYQDRVRGEYLQPWGVAEAMRLGVYDALAERGSVLDRFPIYDEAYSREESEAGAIPLGALVPGVPGALGIGHPIACRVLEGAAADAGAVVIHGVGEVAVAAGNQPTVRFRGPDGEREVRCRIVLGADGRESGVRRQLGMELHRTEARVFIAGMLVEGIDGWPGGECTLGTEGDRLFYVFPQGEGRVRLYLGVRAEERDRLSGPDRAVNFLRGFRLDSLPDGSPFTEASPAGPCAGYPMYDSWVDTPLAEGVALMGDAAGFSDPVIGEGLSIALRDARMVSEALLASRGWSPDALTEYATERTERMRRLRFVAQLFTDCHEPGVVSVEQRRRRMDLLNGGDQDLFLAQASMLCGPEAAPPHCFEDAVRDRVLAVA